MRNRFGRVMALGLCLLAAGCGRTEPEAGSAEGGAAAPLTDPGIARLLAQLNAAEIGAARTALSRLRTAEVRAFAEAVAREHRAVGRSLDSLAVPEEEAPAAPPAQLATMRAASRAHAELLGSMPPGPSYDQAYVAILVLTHGQAADSLRRWQRVARDEGLRAALGAALPRMRAHLARARALQSGVAERVEAGLTLPAPQDTTWVDRIVRPRPQDSLLDRGRPDTAAAPLPDTTGQ